MILVLGYFNGNYIEDSLQLYKKLQSCMALNVNTEHIDLKHPMIRY